MQVFQSLRLDLHSLSQQSASQYVRRSDRAEQIAKHQTARVGHEKENCSQLTSSRPFAQPNEKSCLPSARRNPHFWFHGRDPARVMGGQLSGTDAGRIQDNHSTLPQQECSEETCGVSSRGLEYRGQHHRHQGLAARSAKRAIGRPSGLC